jgi:hypothetical protein
MEKKVMVLGFFFGLGFFVFFLMLSKLPLLLAENEGYL